MLSRVLPNSDPSSSGLISSAPHVNATSQAHARRAEENAFAPPIHGRLKIQEHWPCASGLATGIERLTVLIRNLVKFYRQARAAGRHALQVGVAFGGGGKPQENHSHSRNCFRFAGRSLRIVPEFGSEQEGEHDANNPDNPEN